MKFIAILALTITTSAFAGWGSEASAVLNEYSAECYSTQVIVDDIVKNDHISGHIVGLPTKALSKFKVLIYVKTNRWYLHPYTNETEGYSYADVKEDGTFSLRTVLRTPSNALAAVLVPKQVVAAYSRRTLKPVFGIFGGVTKFNCSYSITQGNGDFLVDPASAQ